MCGRWPTGQCGVRESGMCASEHEETWVAATHSAVFYTRFVSVADDDRLLATSHKRRCGSRVSPPIMAGADWPRVSASK